MAVGLPLKTTYADGDVYSASDVNDTNGTINAFVNPIAAGKNVIINGGFDVWQRGTSFIATGNGTYLADRWYNTASTNLNLTQDTDVPTNPYFNYSAKLVCTSTASIATKIESANIVNFAGKAVTFSLYAKKTSGTGALNLNIYYPSAKDNFASLTQIGSALTLSAAPSSSWTRYSVTVTLPSNVTNGLMCLINNVDAGTIFITGVQLELGSTATSYSRAGGTIQGELAACQRYYWREGGNSAYQTFANGSAASTTGIPFIVNVPVSMRVPPTSVDYSTLAAYDNITVLSISAVSINGGSVKTGSTKIWVDTTVTGATQYRPYFLITNNSTSAYIGLSAEL
jgi:hypothetical protein